MRTNDGANSGKNYIDPHTLERDEERGTSEEEIKDVIKAGLL